MYNYIYIYIYISTWASPSPPRVTESTEMYLCLLFFPFVVSQTHNPLQNTCIVTVACWALLKKRRFCVQFDDTLLC